MKPERVAERKGKGGRKARDGESLWCVKMIQGTVSIYFHEVTKLLLAFFFSPFFFRPCAITSEISFSCYSLRKKKSGTQNKSILYRVMMHWWQDEELTNFLPCWQSWSIPTSTIKRKGLQVQYQFSSLMQTTGVTKPAQNWIFRAGFHLCSWQIFLLWPVLDFKGHTVSLKLQYVSQLLVRWSK